MSHVPILLAATNGTPTPIQPPGTSYHSTRSSFQTHGTSAGLSLIAVSHVSRDSESSREPLPEESHALSNSSNADDGHYLSFVQGMCIVHVGNHCMTPTPGACSEEPIFGPAERHIDEIDEVT